MNETQKTRADVRMDLAVQLRMYLEEDTERELVWTGTKTHLIELVMYLSDTNMMMDDNGMPLTMTALSRITCERFNMKAPRSLSSYKSQISAMKGTRSKSLLDIAIFQKEKRNQHFLISQYVSVVICE